MRPRFSDWANKSGNKNITQLWVEAREQIPKGWMRHPMKLSTIGSPFALGNPQLNIAFRCGVEQSDKLRACGDLRHSATHLACAVGTPIRLVSWDHVAEITQAVNDRSMDWAFAKSDREADYKQLRLQAERATISVVALKSPVDQHRYGFSAVPYSSAPSPQSSAITLPQGFFQKSPQSFSGSPSYVSSTISERLFHTN